MSHIQSFFISFAVWSEFCTFWKTTSFIPDKHRQKLHTFLTIQTMPENEIWANDAWMMNTQQFIIVEWRDFMCYVCLCVFLIEKILYSRMLSTKVELGWVVMMHASNLSRDLTYLRSAHKQYYISDVYVCVCMCVAIEDDDDERTPNSLGNALYAVCIQQVFDRCTRSRTRTRTYRMHAEWRVRIEFKRETRFLSLQIWYYSYVLVLLLFIHSFRTFSLEPL